MELREGMYVRTEKGIAKYLGLGKDVLTNNEGNHFKHYANQHLFDNDIFEVGHDWGDTLSAEEFKNIDKHIEKEPSYNPIDLIELGDYVNGQPIGEITSSGDYKAVCINCFYKNQRRKLYLESKDIKSIVTKEQFESMSYKVEVK